MSQWQDYLQEKDISSEMICPSFVNWNNLCPLDNAAERAQIRNKLGQIVENVFFPLERKKRKGKSEWKFIMGERRAKDSKKLAPKLGKQL